MSSSLDFLPAASKLGGFIPDQDDAARRKVGEILSANHEKYHCFYNDKNFHNHAAHQILADFSIGASAADLTRHFAYQENNVLNTNYKFAERSKYDPLVAKADPGAGKHPNIEKIGDHNWTKHIGNARYYWAYLHYFKEVIDREGYSQCLEKFVFNEAANEAGRNMLARFLGGVLHGMIHFGYGLEFNLKHVAAEGMAMTTSTSATHLHLFPDGWQHSATVQKAESLSLVALMNEMLHDDRLSPQALGLKSGDLLTDTPFVEGAPGFQLINAYSDKWSAVSGLQVDSQAALDDLALFSVLTLGAVPKLGGRYRHDFFLVHCNNAHLFTALILPELSASSQRTFLRAMSRYFFWFWIVRGRPTFTIQHWLRERDESKELDWPKMFEISRQHVDEHLPKAVRALHWFSKNVDSEKARRDLSIPGLFVDGEDAFAQIASDDIFALTSRELIRQQSGELTSSAKEVVGSDQEFWDYKGFFPDLPEDAKSGH